MVRLGRESSFVPSLRMSLTLCLCVSWPILCARQQVTEEDILMENEDGDCDCDDIADGVLILPRCLTADLICQFVSSPTTTTTVPNCCIICLDSYKVGESVVWSSNHECPHAFHRRFVIYPISLFRGGGELYSVAYPYQCRARLCLVTCVYCSCIMKYLDKIHKRVERTPCPCCRRSFTDLQVEERQKKVSIFGRHAPRLSRFLQRGN
jgi:hypothetical protein